EGWINVSSYPNIDFGKIFDIGGNAGRIILSSSYTNGFEFVISENNVNNDAMAQIHDFNTTDSWIHIAGVWDGLSFIHLYINGIIIASNTIPSTIISVSINPSSPMEIGRRYSGVDYFHGLNSNLSFWNIALDSTQIQQYMISPPIGSEEGLIANWNFNDGSGEILYDHSGNQNHGTINGATWVSNTDFESLTISPLSLNFGEVRLGESGELTVDFGNNGEEELSVNITPTDQLSISLDDFIVYPGSSVPVNITYTPTVEGEYIGSLNILSNDVGDSDFDMEITGIGVAEPIINIAPDSLHFDVVVFDDTLATQTLTITNTGFDTLEVSLNSSGESGYALGFNSINEEKVEISMDGLPAGNSPRTLSVRVYPFTNTHDMNVLSYGDGLVGNNRFSIFIGASNQLKIVGQSNDFSTGIYIQDNEWTNICVTFNSSVLKVFINGVLITTSNRNYNTNSNFPLMIGTNTITRNDEFFDGIIDEVLIFNSDLTDSLVQEIYMFENQYQDGLIGYWNFNEGEGNILHDRSGNGNDGTIYGATWVDSSFSTSVEWLTLSETTLTIPPGESANIEITANANGYECGDYDGSIQLTTNDPENPAIEIPVNMSVLYPTALVDESPINFGEVGFNNTAEIQVPIMNDGCYSLEAIASLENANLTISPDTLFVEAGDTSFFTITMASDMDEAEIEGNLVFSYNDPSNNSDTISVSATIVPDIHPIITNIEDVPNDQGGWVRVHFTRSYHDTDSLRNTEQYTVEVNDGNGWMISGSGNAHAEGNYIILIHTTTDSSSTNDGLIDFRIIAGMEEGNFVSEVVTGYSVDNIIPSELSGLTVSSASSENITLDWTANIDDDLAGYNIYRDNEEPSFSTVSGYSDNEPLNTHFTYIVKAVDVHGNESIGSRMYMNRHQLAFGNNLISLPGNLENDSSQDLLNELSINNCANPIFLLGQGVGLFKTVDGWSGNLNNVLPTSGYWLNVDGSCDFNKEDWTVDVD
ncbi:MAG: choice-of-anchor D domain-containing protein, partial [Candidatus Pelagibacter sp.]|nr:choice-of-anchor D domain-containing protein [Candidatus Pelagibacter sp.]